MKKTQVAASILWRRRRRYGLIKALPVTCSLMSVFLIITLQVFKSKNIADKQANSYESEGKDPFQRNNYQVNIK